MGRGFKRRFKSLAKSTPVSAEKALALMQELELDLDLKELRSFL